MPIGVTLDELVLAVRAEIGDSTNPAMGIDALPRFYQVIKRIQETYHMDFDWPQLIINPTEDIVAGQRYYTFNADVDFARIYTTHVIDGGVWLPMDYGIDPEHYNSSDSDAGQTESAPRRWVHYGENQFEIWPVPNKATKIKFRCIRALPRFTAGTDKCVIDSTLLVLTAAAEMLAVSKSEDAKLKLSMATSHYNRIKGRFQKDRMFVTNGALPSRHGSCIRVPR